MKKILAILGIIVLMSAPTALAEPCNGDFDCNGGVDIGDFITFMTDFFFRGLIYENPCEPCRYIDIPKTGQSTICSDNTGNVIDCVNTGQDGEYQRGFTWLEPRFLDHGDGTVTDTFTGLMWAKNANLPGGSKNWQEALDYVAEMNAETHVNLGYTDWSLPNVRELHSLIDFGEHDPALQTGHPFINVQSSFYWSSTTYVDSPDFALDVGMRNGFVARGRKDYNVYVWPVRGGH